MQNTNDLYPELPASRGASMAWLAARSSPLCNRTGTSFQFLYREDDWDSPAARFTRNVAVHVGHRAAALPESLAASRICDSPSPPIYLSTIRATTPAAFRKRRRSKSSTSDNLIVLYSSSVVIVPKNKNLQSGSQRHLSAGRHKQQHALPRAPEHEGGAIRRVDVPRDVHQANEFEVFVLVAESVSADEEV